MCQGCQTCTYNFRNISTNFQPIGNTQDLMGAVGFKAQTVTFFYVSLQMNITNCY